MTIDCAIEAVKGYWKPNQYALKKYVIRDGGHGLCKIWPIRPHLYGAGIRITSLTRKTVECLLVNWRETVFPINLQNTREGIIHFTHEGRHYLLTSGMTGYVPNPSEVAVSDDPLGPYVPIGNPHRKDESCASFNSQVSFIFQAPQWDNFYLVMADRWVPKYVVTGERYQQILRVVARQSDKSYKPRLADYLTVAGAPFLGTANTSIAEYVWLPMSFEGEMPVIDWHNEWTIEELAGKGKGDAGV